MNPIVASSAEAASQWQGPIRLLFIDGDHSYEASRQDLELWSPFVVPHGLICFHDIPGWEGVTRFYRELMSRTTAYREAGTVLSMKIVQKLPATPGTAPHDLGLAGRTDFNPFPMWCCPPQPGTGAARAGGFAEAETALRESLALAPDNAEAWNDLGAVLQQSGRLPEAARTLERGAVAFRLRIGPGKLAAPSCDRRRRLHRYQREQPRGAVAGPETLR